MYAVIETGGRQYRVTSGDVISVQKLIGNKGDKVEFHAIHLLQGVEGLTIPEKGQSTKVVGEILVQGLEKKVLVFKKKRRKNYRRTQGHRQRFTSVKVTEIVV